MEQPFTHNHLAYYAEKILTASQNNYALTIVSPPKSGMSVAIKYICDNFEKCHASKLSKPLFIRIQLQDTDPTEFIIEQLNYHLGSDHEVSRKSGWFGINKSLEALFQKFPKVIFVVSKTPRLLLESNSCVSPLYDINNSYPTNVQYLFTYEEEFPSNTVLKNLFRDIYPLVCSNIEYFPTGPAKETEYILKIKTEEMGMKLDKKLVQAISAISGNLPGIYLELLREVTKTSDYSKTFAEMSQNKVIMNIFHLIWGSFSSKTQKELLETEHYVNSYLEGTRLKTEDDGWFTPIYDDFIKTLKDNQSGKMTSNDRKNLMAMLSWQELTTFELLRKNTGDPVSKEDIAKEIWKDQWGDKYSDWAISQLIHQIRRKTSALQDIEIKTIKGTGYSMKKVT